jgi:hypothetical protein
MANANGDVEALREEIRELRAALLVWVEGNGDSADRSPLQRYSCRGLAPLTLAPRTNDIQPSLARLAAVLTGDFR